MVSGSYRRQRVLAPTLNQLNNLLVKLENIATMDEVERIVALTTETPRSVDSWRAARESEWRGNVDEWKKKPGFESPHHFVRLWNRPSASLYRSQSIGRSVPRCLIVCFTGGQQRMMVPTWIFLALLPPESTYVLFVRSDRAQFGKGLPGITLDFDSTVTWIATMAQSLGVRIDVVCGSSGGALPALIAGAMLGVPRRVLFGLPHLSDPRDGLDALSENASPRHRDSGEGLVVVVGESEARDVAAATQVAENFPRARFIWVTDASHNVIEPLAQRGEFHTLFREVFRNRRWRWS